MEVQVFLYALVQPVHIGNRQYDGFIHDLGVVQLIGRDFCFQTTFGRKDRLKIHFISPNMKKRNMNFVEIYFLSIFFRNCSTQYKGLRINQAGEKTILSNSARAKLSVSGILFFFLGRLLKNQLIFLPKRMIFQV